jgi:hypothetical protein
MYDFHKHPTHVVTNYLGLSGVTISHVDASVRLYGLYGNLLDGKDIIFEFETDFETLNELLEMGEEIMEGQKDDAITAIAGALTHPVGDDEFIDMEDKGGLWFYDHLFLFQAIGKGDEEGAGTEEGQPCYILHGYVERGALLPMWIDLDFTHPDPEQRVQHYNRILALQYHFYALFVKKIRKSQALHFCGLINPLVFSLARELYELEAKGR